MIRRLGIATALLLAGLFVALLVYGVSTRSPDRSLDESLAAGEAVAPPGFKLNVLEPGDPHPAFQKAASDGKVDLEELRGTPVVLNFWASWCPPCREESPTLQKRWERERESGDVLFLGLDQQDLTGDARDFLKEFSLSYPVVRDPTNRTARDWGVTGLPETWFISAAGKVTGHVVGVASEEQLDQGIASARAGRPAAKEEGGARRSTE